MHYKTRIKFELPKECMDIHLLMGIGVTGGGEEMFVKGRD